MFIRCGGVTTGSGIWTVSGTRWCIRRELERSSDENVLYAVTLMSNHGHEVYGIGDRELFSRQMRRHHGRYGQDFNRVYGRSGKVAEDRPKTCLLENEHFEMRVTFYIHANPLRAGMVWCAIKFEFWSKSGLKM